MVSSRSHLFFTALFVLGLSATNGTANPPTGQGSIALSSLDLGHVITGWGTANANKTVDGAPLRIGGKSFASGVGVHAQSHIRIALDGKASSFHSWVGVDDEIPPSKSGTVIFRVRVDGAAVWESGLMKNGEAAKEVTLPLTGARTLALDVDDGGDGIHNDHADWADASIVGDAAAIKTVPIDTSKHFANPDRIRYDGHCMTIEGQDVFIYSAAFHYFRTPPELWRDRFRKIKAAGFNTVESYVPWNWHERDMPAGPDDFSKCDFTELEAWLKMAQEEFGLYTIVRPGPFICAEWGGGAYPRWLAKFGPGTGGLWLRGADPEHVKWCRHWYDAVCKVFAREQISRKPKGSKGIIMVQIENEYDAHQTGGKEVLLRGLYHSVMNAGIDIPVFTCLTGECRASKDLEFSQIFDCDNYYVGLRDAPDCARRMASLRARQKDAPGMVTELQGGWFSLVTQKLSEENYSDERHFNAINLMSLLGGATGINDYVFVGGTHFAGWGARGMTTSYDYNAAIHENGAVGPKYGVAKSIAEFIHANTQQLLRSEGGPCELRNAPKNLFGGVRISPDGTRFVFLHNTDPQSPASGTVTLLPGQMTRPTAPMYNIDRDGNKVAVTASDTTTSAVSIEPFDVAYDLAPLGAKVLVIPPSKASPSGTWYPKTQPPAPRSATLPAAVRIASVKRKNDPFGTTWQPVPAGVSLPEMQVSDARYVLYRSHFKLTAGEAATQTHLLFNTFSRDILTAEINGRPATRVFPSDAAADAQTWVSRGAYNRIGPDEFDNVFDASGQLREGENEIVVCYENLGHAHGYIPM